MPRYAIIDNASGYIWGCSDSATLIEACQVLDRELGESLRAYIAEIAPRFDSESGYNVYSVPDNYTVYDGTSQTEIDHLKEIGTMTAYVRIVRYGL